MKAKPLLHILLTLICGSTVLFSMAYFMVWYGLSLRGIEHTWWPVASFQTEIWPDSYLKLIGEFGPIGDFIGGVLNPLVALCAFMALFISLQFQRLSVAQQLDQENFFTLLQSRESAIAQLEVHLDGRTVSGRAVIREVVKYLSIEGAALPFRTKVRGVYSELVRQGNTKEIESLRKRASLFATLYRGRVFDVRDTYEGDALLDFQRRFDLESLEDLLGHIFRSTYQVLKFAHGCPSFTKNKKLDLVNYLRAQMSESEFIVFGLSALTPVGKKSRAVSIAFNFFEDRLSGGHVWARAMRTFFDPAEAGNAKFARSYKYPLLGKRLSSTRVRWAVFIRRRRVNIPSDSTMGRVSG